MQRFNLNCDMAEGYGPWSMGDDDGLLEIVQTANIACGYHGGDHNIMARVMKSAQAQNVSIGAHPGFYDLHGFGRRPMQLAHREIENLLAYQIGAACSIATLVDAEITHIKPHGALNNMACADRPMSDAITRAVKAVSPNLILLAPALSKLAESSIDSGLITAIEVFADRTYQPDGQLTSRRQPDALITDSDQALKNCLRMIGEGEIKATDGTILEIAAHSVCIHGDEPTARSMAKHIKDGLIKAGFKPATLPEMMA